MSEKALTDTIYLEMKMLRSSGYERCYIVPGNYGMDFLTEQLELDAELTVKCSNYVGEAIEDARLLGMKGILLIGHVGKWVKLAAGVMNTHSRQADCRMEVLAVHAAMQGADRESVCRIMQCLNTTEALKTIRQLGILEQVMASVMERIDFYLSGRAGENLRLVQLCSRMRMEFWEKLRMQNNYWSRFKMKGSRNDERKTDRCRSRSGRPGTSDIESGPEDQGK